ncbi:hypothetical protein PoB_000341800 [Plakobranchus ocellatus]|uniref:Uncharacterized protein n=1 Tax=Plakobranchus ocellatus TaxID=259542 RepID=A0AAV3Y3Y5_9GAST|nr:hypothetical protein PoB_000341800 [Plakobranchus ocellatus]
MHFNTVIKRFDDPLLNGASVAQWLVIPPLDLQGAFCRGLEPRHRRPVLTEGLKTWDQLVVDWLYTNHTLLSTTLLKSTISFLRKTCRVLFNQF